MRDQLPTRAPSSEDEIRQLRARLHTAETKLAEAEQIISAIRSGEIDAVVVSGPTGDQIFTLQGAEYAYRALVEEMSEGAVTVGMDGTVLYCNQRLSDLMHRPMEQIIGASVFSLFLGEHRETFTALFFEAQMGRGGSTELEMNADQSQPVPVHVSLRAMTTLEPITICLVVTDLKDRKTNEELLAAGRLADTILNSAAEAIAVCDPGGEIIKANEAFRALCRCNPLFQRFDSVLQLAKSVDQKERFSATEALTGTIIRALEVTVDRDDSQRTHLLLSASPIRSDLTIIGCVFTMTDVTKGKLAQTAMLRSEKLASVGRMASTIAHEINNPLETIGQSIYLAMTDEVISEAAKSYLGLAVVELERIAMITKQTLAFHRDSSSAKILDLKELTESVLRFFVPRLMARGVLVEKRFAENTHILAFSGEIRQVVSNLLSNSMDAVSNGGRIQVKTSRIKDKQNRSVVRLSIGDTGSGIAESSIKTIFEPFFTTKVVIGTGLGLWVTKQIVEKHNAHIRVRSRPGAGTVFTIDFPAAEQTNDTSGSQAESRSNEETNSSS